MSTNVYLPNGLCGMTPRGLLDESEKPRRRESRRESNCWNAVSCQRGGDDRVGVDDSEWRQRLSRRNRHVLYRSRGEIPTS